MCIISMFFTLLLIPLIFHWQYAKVYDTLIILRDRGRYMLKFEPNNLKALHFFTEGLNYPVAIAAYSDWQENQLSYLVSNFQSKQFTTESVCRWCMSHNLQFQIIYPISKISIIKNPYKFFKFLQLKYRLAKI